MRSVRFGLAAMLTVLVPASAVIVAASAVGASTADLTVLLSTRVPTFAKDPASKPPIPPVTSSTLTVKEANGTVVSCTSAQSSVAKFNTYETVTYACTAPTPITATYILSIVGNPPREHVTAGMFNAECYTTYNSTSLSTPQYTYSTQQWTCGAPHVPAPPTAPPKK